MSCWRGIVPGDSDTATAGRAVPDVLPTGVRAVNRLADRIIQERERKR